MSSLSVVLLFAACGGGAGTESTDTLSLPPIDSVKFNEPDVILESEHSSNDGSATLRTAAMSVSVNVPTSPAPAFSGLKVFEAIPPYSVKTRDGTWDIPLGAYPYNVNKKRRFDFIGPIINPETGHTNALSLQTAVEYDGRIKFMNLTDTSHPVRATNAGSSQRLEYNPTTKLLTTAYRAGDPASSEKNRVQINTFPVPNYQMLTWDLSFKLGGDKPNETWPMTQPTVSPKLLWQIKSDNYEDSNSSFPSMGYMVDTDYADKSSIRLTFFLRKDNVYTPAKTWTVGGLKAGQFIDVVIQSSLTDIENGSGILKVWVNNKLLAYNSGRNLIQRTITTQNKDLLSSLNRGAFGLYLMSEKYPLPDNYVVQWRKARMLVNSP